MTTIATLRTVSELSTVNGTRNIAKEWADAADRGKMRVARDNVARALGMDLPTLSILD